MLVIQVQKELIVTAEVWKSIIKGWIVAGIGAALAWAVAKGMIPADMSAQAATGALAGVTALASAYLSARAKLEAEARAQLEPTATWAEIEARMIGIGYGRLLFALKGKTERDPQIEVLERRLAKLEEWAEAIQKTRQAQSSGAQ